MTRGRKPAPVTDGIAQGAIADAPPAIGHDMAASAAVVAGTAMVLQYEQVIRDLGRIDSLEFTRRVADVAIAQVFENIRNSGAYKDFPYIDDNGKHATVASIEQFCELKLGKSYRRCLDLSQNLRALGPELYEQSEKLGLRNLDYKALRALPADEQAMVKKAIEETQSRDEVLDILQELAAKHQRDKEGLTRQVEELEANAEATGRLMQEKNVKLDQLAAETRKTKKPHQTPWPEEVAGLKDDLHNLGKVMDEAFGKHLTLVDATELMIDPLDDNDARREGYKTVVHRLSEQIERWCTLAAALRSQYETRLGGYIALDKTHILPD